ncbi:ATP-binding cassette, subfamily C, CydC [Georgenia satyanarayanai]|uniref:ATP-binding cassette, subfamily C, CydC n=1 Tax=Georgenia satyanarayanai TaxID=860221 RepID=A0A2Y8ZYK3_9MICO|nr:thiol reductant ABC exporter subunit CydC [Georgenia satyanarayanai]PYG01558.1 ATP-binding cassette subfamily C protein CydC [Georgenia satyanarayanai]SSA36358.1 ATP-binding cassette, subfamily C, CydC [Georgenia satyanarayanai]
MSLLPLSPAERRALRRAVDLLDLDRWRFLLAVLAGTAGLGSAVGLSATAAWLIARASQMPPVLELGVASVAVRTFGIARGLMRYVERLVSHEVALRGMATLRERVYTTLADAPTDVVSGLRRGDVLARTGADVDAVGDVVVRALLPAAVAAVVGTGTVILVAWLHLGIGAVLAACLLLAGVAAPLLTMRAARLDELARARARTELTAGAMAMVEGAAELTVSGGLPRARAALAGTEQRLARTKDAAARPAALAAGTDHLAMGLAVLAALVLGVHATVAGTMEAVELAVVVLTPLAAFEGTALLGPAAVQLVRSAEAAVRVTELLDGAGAGPSAGSGPAGRVEEAAGAADAGAPWAATGAGATRAGAGEASPAAGGAPVLRARDLAVGWPRTGIVAEGLDLEVRPGRSVAVVGPSGIGKTTLLLTLAGLVPPRRGEVRIGAGPVAELDRRTVSGAVVLTAEDAHVFGTTVLENLRVARGDVSPAEAVELLGRAGLAEWLTALHDGVHTLLDSDATSLSGGERRRLLLARALASRAPLLLLDEPGEHLDPATADRLVGDLLATRDQGRGVLLVTHRLAPLAAADEVVVLGASQGPATVLARGTHEHLLQTLPRYRWAVEQEAR